MSFSSSSKSQVSSSFLEQFFGEKRVWQWQRRWEAWRETLELLEVPVAWLEKPDASEFFLNQAAKNDLKVVSDSVGSEALFKMNRDFLINDGEVLIWFGKKSAKHIEPPSLTPREKEVFLAMTHGKSLKETSSLLGISTRTIEKHRENIRVKMKSNLSG